MCFTSRGLSTGRSSTWCANIPRSAPRSSGPCVRSKGRSRPYCIHENFDGTGYPYGLKGSEIPLAARVVAVADAFDAMTSDRPYRAAVPVMEAFDRLDADDGQRWDRDVVDAFLALYSGNSRTADIPEGL